MTFRLIAFLIGVCGFLVTLVTDQHNLAGPIVTTVGALLLLFSLVERERP